MSRTGEDTWPGQGAERFELLAAVGRVAEGTLLLGETVHRLLDTLVPAFADLVTLDAISPRGELRRLGVRMGPPRDPRVEAALLRRRLIPGADFGVTQAIAASRSRLETRVTDELLQRIAADEADFALLRSLNLHDALFIPLKARGRTIGALGCGMSSSGRRLTGDDQRFAEVLAGRIALALDHAGLAETVGELERRLEATLANLAEAVIVRGVDGRMLFTNQAAADLLDAASPDELMAASSDELMAYWEAADEEGRGLALHDLPSARALQGQRPEPMLVRNVSRASGRVRWLMHKATPVFDPAGDLSMVVNVIEDVSEAKRAEQAQRLLAQAGKELSSSLDHHQTLQRVAQLAVPELADWCAVAIRGQGDELRQVAVAHVDPAKVALAREWAALYPASLSVPTGAARAINSGRSEHIRHVTDDVMATLPADAEQLALIRRLNMRSVIFVPLAVAGRQPFGALVLVMAESGRIFHDEDLAVAEELGRRAATGVENARLYTERSRVAETLQQSLLPPKLSDIPGFELATLYHPAGEDSDVGGDFYDAFEVPGGWMVLVGDVAGHGAEAAALTSLSRYTLRTAGKLLGDPVATLAQLNDALCERPYLSLVSVCCAFLREAGGEVIADVVLAGHPPAFHLHRGEPAPTGVPAPLLGISTPGQWPAETVRLQIGDQLVLYTDGVTDTVGDDGRFGPDRLAAALQGAPNAAGVIGRVEGALRGFAAGPQRDDTAVLAVQRLSANGQPAALLASAAPYAGR